MTRAGIISIVVASLCVIGGAASLMTGPVPALCIIAVILFGITLQHPALFAALTGLAIPFAAIAAVSVGGVNVALCDIFALAGVVSMMVRNSLDPKAEPRLLRESIKAAKPIILLALPYILVALTLTLFTYPSPSTFFTVIQRGQIVIMWVLFGAMLFKLGLTKHFARAFVLGCSALSLLWIATPGVGNVIGIQKNPSGGVIACAVLIMLLSKAKNIQRMPITLLLIGGLVSTGSRGSILGLCAAVGVMIVLRVQWKRLVFPLVVGGAAAAVAIALLPEDVSARLLNENADAAYNIDIRQTFIDDALWQFHEAPWTGLGVGNYMQLDSRLARVITHDPHNVFALTLAEGGYPLITAFVLLVAGTLLWMFRAKKTWICGLAIAMQVSTFVHSWVDVYWVRGTPTIGWAITGALAMSILLDKQKKGSEAMLAETPEKPKRGQRLPRHYERLVKASARSN